MHWILVLLAKYLLSTLSTAYIKYAIFICKQYLHFTEGDTEAQEDLSKATPLGGGKAET